MPLQTRITAKEALEHDWVREDGGAPESALAPEVLTRFKSFAAMPPLKKLGLMLLVRHLHAEEVEGLRRIFLDMDADGSGGLSADEIAAGLQRHGAEVAREEVEQLLEARGATDLASVDCCSSLAVPVLARVAPTM